MDMAVDWQVESLRISVFPDEMETISPSKLWELHISDTEPEIHIQPGKTNQRNAKHENGDMYLVKTANQVDWRYVLTLDDSSDERDLPAWGDFEHELDGFIGFSTDFLQNPDVLPLNRLAFGAVLMKPTLDAPKTHRHLKGFLPKLDLEDSADFGYTISRRRSSNVVTALQINRLNRWHVATINRNTSTLDPAADAKEHRLEQFFAARLELDINTVPLEKDERLNSALLPDLFEELVDMGMEISTKGDMP